MTIRGLQDRIVVISSTINIIYFMHLNSVALFEELTMVWRDNLSEFAFIASFGCYMNIHLIVMPVIIKYPLKLCNVTHQQSYIY